MDLLMWELLDWLLAGATESADNGREVRKVMPSTMDFLTNLPFRLSAEAVEGLIEGACKGNQLLS